MQKELEQIKRFVNGMWARSLAAMVAIVLGFVAGTLTAQWRIMDDCKFINSFRVDNHAFACQRRI